MKALFFSLSVSLLLTGCLSNKAFNALGNMSDRLSEHYYQQDLMQLQHKYDIERINRQYPQQSSVIAKLTIITNPAGAEIMELNSGAKLSGLSPIVADYLRESVIIDATGCFVVNGFLAEWSDGKRIMTTPTIRLCHGERYDYQITIQKQ